MTVQDNVDKILSQSALIASGVSMIPNALVSAAGLSVLHYRMIERLCTAYGISYDASKLTIGINAVTISALSTVLSEALAQVVESSRGLRMITGGVSATVLNPFVTITIGRIYSAHFARGGTMLDFNMNTLIDLAAKQLTMDNLKYNYQLSSHRDYASLLA